MIVYKSKSQWPCLTIESHPKSTYPLSTNTKSGLTRFAHSFLIFQKAVGNYTNYNANCFAFSQIILIIITLLRLSDGDQVLFHVLMFFKQNSVPWSWSPFSCWLSARGYFKDARNSLPCSSLPFQGQKGNISIQYATWSIV